MTFTASDGSKVYEKFDGGIRLEKGMDGYLRAAGLYANEVNTLREYFQHERDDRLGLWRWPDNPSYVVRETMPPGAVMVSNEKTLVSYMFEERDTGRSEWGRAARAYFEAHPTPRPIKVQVEQLSGVWVDVIEYTPGTALQMKEAELDCERISGSPFRSRIIRDGDEED